MGQASQKIQQKISQMGFSSLPKGYVLNENNIFRSQSSPVALKGLAVLLNPKDIDSYLSHLQFRKQHKQLIQVLYVDVKKQQTEYCKIIVYIEWIQLRLEETFSVHFNNMIKTLYHSLQGFKLLFEKFGYFTVDASLIGINEEGIPKCWINKKYSVSTPKPSFSYNKVKNAESSMVEELKEVFRCQVDKATVPHKFMLQNNTFQSLINEITSKFGDQFLTSKIDMHAPQPTSSLQTAQSSALSSVRSALDHKTSSGTQIRFNYQMKQSNKSGIKITFNNNKSVEVTRRTSTSLQNKERPKVNFSYKQNTTAKVEDPLEKSLIHQLQFTKADDRSYAQNARVAVNQ